MVGSGDRRAGAELLEITQNCDAHPLLKLMHKPEKDKAGQVLPLDQQDKRAVAPLERNRWDEWLHGSVEQGERLIQLPPIEIFRHGAGVPSKNMPLPGEASKGQISAQSQGLF